MYSYSAGSDPQASLMQTIPQNADSNVKPSIGYVKHLHRVISRDLRLLWGSADSRGQSSLVGAEDEFN